MPTCCYRSFRKFLLEFLVREHPTEASLDVLQSQLVEVITVVALLGITLYFVLRLWLKFTDNRGR